MRRCTRVEIQNKIMEFIEAGVFQLEKDELIEAQRLWLQTLPKNELEYILYDVLEYGKE